MAGRAFVGTSGFAYPEWKGSFYPAGLPGTRLLGFYAERLASVEINYTFRRTPTPKVIEAWRSATPDGFRFAVKASMRITHMWPLDPPDDVLAEFLDPTRTLGERLGPVLFQTGPRFAFDRDRLERFLDRLPEGIAAAFEFRHPSWEEARPILAARGAAWCASETDTAPVEDVPGGPSSICACGDRTTTRRGWTRGRSGSGPCCGGAATRTCSSSTREATRDRRGRAGSPPRWAGERPPQVTIARRASRARRMASSREGSSTRRPSRSRT